MRMQRLVAPSNLLHFCANLLFLFGFIAEAGITYERNTHTAIGKGGARFGLIAADYWWHNHCPRHFQPDQPDHPGRRGKRSSLGAMQAHLGLKTAPG